MKIEDIKQAYPEFKFWKDNYTLLNLDDSVYVYSNPGDKSVRLLYNKSSFYLLYGELYGTSEFIKWILAGHRTTITFKDVKLLKDALKKNIISIEYTDEYFKYTFKDKTDAVVSITFMNTGISDQYISYITSVSKDMSECVIDNHYFESGILKLYLDKDNKVVSEKTENALLEIPVYNLLPTKNKLANTYYIGFTPRTEFGRHVLVSSKSEKLLLTQLFKTI